MNIINSDGRTDSGVVTEDSSEHGARSFHHDELSRLDDIEALMTTARDLAARFKGFEMNQTASSIQSAISSLRIARSHIIDRARTR